jgi:hypothetical protein
MFVRLFFDMHHVYTIYGVLSRQLILSAIRPFSIFSTTSSGVLFGPLFLLDLFKSRSLYGSSIALPASG